MLGDQTYRQWTNIFNPEGGSYFEGSWDKGANIRFIGPTKDGKLSGMYARIAESRPPEFVSIEHLGEIQDGKEVPSPQMAGAHENYTLTEKDGVTKVDVDLEAASDMADEYAEMSEQMWPKALSKLKEIAEAE